MALWKLMSVEVPSARITKKHVDLCCGCDETTNLGNLSAEGGPADLGTVTPGLAVMPNLASALGWPLRKRLYSTRLDSALTSSPSGVEVRMPLQNRWRCPNPTNSVPPILSRLLLNFCKLSASSVSLSWVANSSLREAISLPSRTLSSLRQSEAFGPEFTSCGREFTPAVPLSGAFELIGSDLFGLIELSIGGFKSRGPEFGAIS
mmetsp:Transcript_37646/g.63342  ORF Transcript_37646/g.63342 Transcript_37646/m.63342 type:complete len:205 (-) Transcript_37646:781-1395(-)